MLWWTLLSMAGMRVTQALFSMLIHRTRSARLLTMQTVLFGGLMVGWSSAFAGDWEVGVGVGYGERGNPLVDSDDFTVLIDLDIAWYGNHWFFDSGDVGYTWIDNRAFTLNTVVRVNSDRLFFSRTNTQFISLGEFAVAPEPGQFPLDAVAVPIDIPDRDYAIEIGAELLAEGRWGFLQSSVYSDISNTHNGVEVSTSYGYSWRGNRWYIEPSLLLSWKSASLNDYYWGVREFEIAQALGPYRAESGLNVGARFRAGYQIDEHWAWSAAIEYERLNDEAADSPIVDDNDVFGFFFGIGFRF
ncbi:MAG: MipA/OmpV family protein [Gammaproteobacteria bacterium]|nr:MipA/OmpV family protein [Gammaproteobacteria bacterium]